MSLKIGIVGATGMVGAEFLDTLERRRFPVGELLVFSSGKTKKSVVFRGRRLDAPAVSIPALCSCDLVFFAGADEISKKLAPQLVQKGVWVIDDSSAFRLDSRVPLVIPEANAKALAREKRLIAGPNCTMTGLAVAAAALQKEGGIKEVRISSYQSVSGAGRDALAEFFGQAQDDACRLKFSASGRAPIFSEKPARFLPGKISGNVIPQVGIFDPAGNSSEEIKVAAELRKVLNAPFLRVSVTAVRVPVVRTHCLAAWIVFRRPFSVQKAARLLKKAPGIKFYKGPSYPTPLSCAGKYPVSVGRLRQGLGKSELCLWVVSDNLLKGAALNSVQIAEELLRRGWLKA
jgi:aspartate-semialdehyde dehydrogenase